MTYFCTHPASTSETLHRCGCGWACPWNKTATGRVFCSPPTCPRGPRRRRRGPVNSPLPRATDWRSDRSPRWGTHAKAKGELKRVQSRSYRLVPPNPPLKAHPRGTHTGSYAHKRYRGEANGLFKHAESLSDTDELIQPAVNDAVRRSRSPTNLQTSKSFVRTFLVRSFHCPCLIWSSFTDTGLRRKYLSVSSFHRERSTMAMARRWIGSTLENWKERDRISCKYREKVEAVDKVLSSCVEIKL